MMQEAKEEGEQGDGERESEEARYEAGEVIIHERHPLWMVGIEIV